MLKFITKVWVAGEVNDFRINRKKRKQEQKQLKKAERQQRIVELGEIERILEENNENSKRLSLEWRMCQHNFLCSFVLFLISSFIGMFFPFVLALTIIDMPLALYYAIKLTRLKNKILRE